MSHSDPVADFLTRVRNAVKARHRYVDVPYSGFICNIAEVLRESCFVEHILVRKEGNIQTMRVFLKYAENRKPVLSCIRSVSTPGCRSYVGSQKIPSIMNGLGLVVISTSQGVMSGSKARALGLGGEYVCYVW